ncbi:MAG: DEAD/DEAH box helicase, partial [Myxococcota bacterium]|nr:DEAD/DEAH box helicase [Myxococcota bacterium]
MSTFSDFDLDPAIVAAVEKLGFETTTPVQAETMVPLLEGLDLIGQARTGSGKTAAFGLPMLERVKDGGRSVRGLVLAPTRELALQVAEALREFGKKLPVRVVAIYGGAPYPPQLKALKNGATIVVGTPGRVIDHLDRGTLDLSELEVLVLDEADEMLRMGFLEPVEYVLEAAPETRQIALFSATMPEPIQKVAERFLKDPITIQVETAELSVDHIEQFWVRVPQRHKLDALVRIIRADPHGANLVFTRTRKACAETADSLNRRGVRADAIHGDLNQS